MAPPFHFSDRWQNRVAQPNALTRAVSARRATGRKIFDLTATNPTRCGLERTESRPQDPDDASWFHYDPDARGLRCAREAIAAYYAERGESVDPDAIFLTAGTSEGYGFLFKLLCAPGDTVLVPQPSYPLLHALAELENVNLLPYRLVPERTAPGEARHWRLDRDALSVLADSRLRAVCVIQPNNPTGALLAPDDADFLLRFAAQRGLALVVDEVFADFIHAPSVTTRLLRSSETLVFTLNGLSKTLGLPQLKLAWICVEGEPRAKAQALSHLEWICDAYLSVNTTAQLWTPALLARRAALQAPVRARLRANLETLRHLAATADAVMPLWPQGGWCVPLQCPGLADDEEGAVSLLREQGVLVHPGYFYDFEAEDVLVASLLPPPEVFQTGVQRLIDFFATHAHV